VTDATTRGQRTQGRGGAPRPQVKRDDHREGSNRRPRDNRNEHVNRRAATQEALNHAAREPRAREPRPPRGESSATQHCAAGTGYSDNGQAGQEAKPSAAADSVAVATGRSEEASRQMSRRGRLQLRPWSDAAAPARGSFRPCGAPGAAPTSVAAEPVAPTAVVVVGRFRCPSPFLHRLPCRAHSAIRRGAAQR